jgi:thymidylate synthase
MKNLNFDNANSAFNYLYHAISCEGEEFDGTQAIFNVGFYIEQPWNNKITSEFRKWNIFYAEAEWQWYLSGDPKVEKLGEIYGIVPKIWEKMADEYGEVNSNYGAQWERGYQLDKVIAMLKENPNTRKATISIYDGKEMHNYRQDTPCTYAVQFTVLNNKLDMCVTMRSNDLWFGFCNDQYCFSELQKIVSERTNIEIGRYYHFAHNMHLYARDLNKNKTKLSRSTAHEKLLMSKQKQYH